MRPFLLQSIAVHLPNMRIFQTCASSSRDHHPGHCVQPGRRPRPLCIARYAPPVTVRGQIRAPGHCMRTSRVQGDFVLRMIMLSLSLSLALALAQALALALACSLWSVTT